MAMGIPLVTFAVGGIGEYIELEPSPGSCKDVNTSLLEHEHESVPLSGARCKATTGQSDGFVVAKNAILLEDASPASMAAAVAALVQDEGLRRSVGGAGRQTVERYFSVERQMRQYADLYGSLAQPTHL